MEGDSDVNSSRPTWSVIIPTYNRAGLLVRSIGSVLDQTFADFEIIVVDDGSSDNTLEVVRSFADDRIVYLVQDRNLGAAAARNTGMKQACGRFIAFLDSDDQWERTKLEACHEFSTARELAEEWLGFHQILVQRNRTEYIAPAISLSDSPSFADFLVLDGFVQTSSIFGPRVTISRVQFDQTYAPLEDWDWLIKQTTDGTLIRYLPERLGTHHADTRPGRISAIVDPSVSTAWLTVHESRLSNRARAGFELLRIAPSLKSSRPLRARMVGLRSAVVLWKDFRRTWRPLVAILLPQAIVEQLTRR